MTDPNLWISVLNELKSDGSRQNEMNSKSIPCQKINLLDGMRKL